MKNYIDFKTMERELIKIHRDEERTRDVDTIIKKSKLVIEYHHGRYTMMSFGKVTTLQEFTDYTLWKMFKQGSSSDVQIVERDCGYGGYKKDWYLFTNENRERNLFRVFKARESMLRFIKNESCEFVPMSSLYYKNRLPHKELSLEGIYRELGIPMETAYGRDWYLIELGLTADKDLMLFKDHKTSKKPNSYLRYEYSDTVSFSYSIIYDISNGKEIVNKELDELYETRMRAVSHFGLNEESLLNEYKDLMYGELMRLPEQELEEYRYKAYVNDIMMLNYAINILMSKKLDDEEKDIVSGTVKKLIDSEKKSLYTKLSNKPLKELYIPIYNRHETLDYNSLKDMLVELGNEYLTSI